MRLVRKEAEAFYCESGLRAVAEEDMDALKATVHSTPRNRIRICTHDRATDALHEMFVCYTRDTIVAPHKHVGKDETFYVMEGEMNFITFDDQGAITSITEMAERGKGKPFCVRVPMDTYHTVVLKSDYCLLHESTPGPFDRKDTVWAKWGDAA